MIVSLARATARKINIRNLYSKCDVKIKKYSRFNDNSKSNFLSLHSNRVKSNELGVSEWIVPLDSLNSNDGRFNFIIKSDGNAVLEYLGESIWSTNTYGKVVSAFIVHQNGNVALRGEKNEILWQTNTEGNENVRLVLQNDGNLVLYSADVPLWSSGTGGR